MKTIKAYICGPVTDIHKNNLPAFRAMEEKLSQLGYLTIVPHDLDPEIDYDLQAVLSPMDFKEYVWRKYMQVCLPEVSNSHLVVTLPNWSESRGSKIEVDTARNLGIPVVHCLVVKQVEDFLIEDCTELLRAMAV